MSKCDYKEKWVTAKLFKITDTRDEGIIRGRTQRMQESYVKKEKDVFERVTLKHGTAICQRRQCQIEKIRVLELNKILLEETMRAVGHLQNWKAPLSDVIPVRLTKGERIIQKNIRIMQTYEKTARRMEKIYSHPYIQGVPPWFFDSNIFVNFFFVFNRIKYEEWTQFTTNII